jgi:hypothetical protein
VDAAGRATVFEHRALPAGNEAYLRTSDVAGAWSERTPVSMFGDGAYGVQAAPDGSGGTLLLWMKLDGGLNSVWASRFQPGVGVDLPAVIETEGGEVGDLRLAGSPGGRAVAAWSRHETPALADVYANVYTPGLGWGTARRLDPDDAETAFQPDVGVGPHTVIVWAHANVPHARVNTAGQGWGPVEPLADHTDADRPVVAVSASGHAVAVWTRKGTKPFADLWAARYLPGEGWQTAEIIDSEDLGHAQQPSVALDAHGEGMVVWRQSDGSHTNVWGNRLSQTTGWRGAQRLDEEDTAADDPRVVADGRGQLFVVWQQDAPHRLLMRVVR